MAATDIDVFFDVRNSYYMGAYQQCINQAQNLKTKSPEDQDTKDSFLYRAYIALNKPSIALSEIDVGNASPGLKAVRRFADYMGGQEAKRKAVLAEVQQELEKGSAGDDLRLLMNALVFVHENAVDDALKTLSEAESLEAISLRVQCLLKINRVDLAIKELKKMHEIDEDSTISQMTLAWVNMAAGKEKLRDAFYIFEEMIDKHGATPALLVSQASCQIQQHKYEEAEKLLQDAQQRDSNNPEVLIGLIVVGQFLGKTLEVTNRYVNQLKLDYPNHAWTRDYVEKERNFERLAQETA